MSLLILGCGKSTTVTKGSSSSDFGSVLSWYKINISESSLTNTEGANSVLYFDLQGGAPSDIYPYIFTLGETGGAHPCDFSTNQKLSSFSEELLNIPSVMTFMDNGKVLIFWSRNTSPYTPMCFVSYTQELNTLTEVEDATKTVSLENIDDDTYRILKNLTDL